MSRCIGGATVFENFASSAMSPAFPSKSKMWSMSRTSLPSNCTRGLWMEADPKDLIEPGQKVQWPSSDFTHSPVPRDFEPNRNVSLDAEYPQGENIWYVACKHFRTGRTWAIGRRWSFRQRWPSSRVTRCACESVDATRDWGLFLF